MCAVKDRSVILQLFSTPWRTFAKPKGCLALGHASFSQLLHPVPSLSVWTPGTSSASPKNEHALWKNLCIQEGRSLQIIPLHCSDPEERDGEGTPQPWYGGGLFSHVSARSAGSAVNWQGWHFLLQVLCYYFLNFLCRSWDYFFPLLQIPQVFLQVPMLIIFSEGSALLPLTWCRSLHSKMCTKSPSIQLCRYWYWCYTSHLMSKYICAECI